MSDKTLHQYYLDMLPNLLNEFYFFIPEKEIREDVMEKLDFLKTDDLLNKVYVFDYYQGPILYEKGRNMKYLSLKGNHLEENVFSLLEKKSQVTAHEFNFVLEKYIEITDLFFYVTDWMNTNLTDIMEADDTLVGIFHIQYLNYKKHFETLVKTFFPNRETLPKRTFINLETIEAYFPDLNKNFKKTFTKGTIFSSFNNNNEGGEAIPKTPNKKENIGVKNSKREPKKPLITAEEAEKVLLKTFFGVDIKD